MKYRKGKWCHAAVKAEKADTILKIKIVAKSVEYQKQTDAIYEHVTSNVHKKVPLYLTWQF